MPYLTLSSSANFVQKTCYVQQAVKKSVPKQKLNLIYITKSNFPDSYSLHTFFKKCCFLCSSVKLKANPRFRSYITYALLNRVQRLGKWHVVSWRFTESLICSLFRTFLPHAGRHRVLHDDSAYHIYPHAVCCGL